MSSTQRHIRPVEDLRALLNRVEKPGRYVGGEWGSIVKPDSEAGFRVALTFPELYEIGMSNTAIKILYGLLNAMNGVACERVFVPAPDFEAELVSAGIPLYTLESGIPVVDNDLLAVSFGFELLATNLLTILSASGMELRAAKRGEGDPLVVVGGPGASNPLPIGPFVDGVFVGEAEDALQSIVSELQAVKGRGGKRDDLLAVLERHPSVWTMTSREKKIRRAVWSDFGSVSSVQPDRVVPGSYGAGFPVPSISVIQDHGVVEIMRGCPQGCRFCHAGSYYRPYRMKTIDVIVEEVRWLVDVLGYREVSLSSLSTGDYHDIVGLVRRLTAEFAARGVSFSLPSLRVNSVTLPIFEAISTGKRSGITFAVESADEERQRGINKLVPLERVIEIAREARSRGWQHAKLYFMIGLPVEGAVEEASSIVDYVAALRKAVRMEYIVNVGSFVPKPHTPFQWDRQIEPEAAQKTIEAIRRALPRGTKLRAHDPQNSWLEGVITRGDLATADLIEEAFRRGARLDAWNEYADIDLWKTLVLQDEHRLTAERAMGPFDLNEELPWRDVTVGVSDRHLKQERERATARILTERCAPNCEVPCGVCNKFLTVRDYGVEANSDETERAENTGGGTNTIVDDTKEDTAACNGEGEDPHGREYQLVVSYSKRGSAAFLPHLALVRTFERAWNRICLPVALTRGYNPKPKMSFGQPLPLGSESEDELVIVNVQKIIQLDRYCHELHHALPDGFLVHGMVLLHHEKGSKRIPSPMQRYGGSVYRIGGDRLDNNTETDAVYTEWTESVRLVFERNGAKDAKGVVDRSCRMDQDGAEQRGEFQVFLPESAPGIGRILKECEQRDRLRVTRLAMIARLEPDDDDISSDMEEGEHSASVRLYDYYRNLENCVTWS